MISVALTAMAGAVLAVHLGLAVALVRFAHKVAECAKCTTFWVALIALLYDGAEPAIAAMLALLCAYLSYWVGLLLQVLQHIYNVSCRRINKLTERTS
jgi:hypothetical protein